VTQDGKTKNKASYGGVASRGWRGDNKVRERKMGSRWVGKIGYKNENRSARDNSGERGIPCDIDGRGAEIGSD